jgi:hypothetical protein
MKTKIQPTQAGFPQEEATEIDITVRFDLGAKTSQSYWVLLNEANQKVADGNLDIPEEIHTQWGTDDTLVLDYILLSLGLTKLTEQL